MDGMQMVNNKVINVCLCFNHLMRCAFCIFNKLTLQNNTLLNMYSVRNLDMSIRISLKSRPSEGFPWPEMSQMKAEISLHSNVKLIFHKNVGWQGYQWIP